MLSSISALILKIWGWKVTGHYPYELAKVVVAVAPHTSNWDFPVGVLVNSAGKFKANYVGKHSIFRWPFGVFFRWLGGIPVDRSKSHNSMFNCSATPSEAVTRQTGGVRKLFTIWRWR